MCGFGVLILLLYSGYITYRVTKPVIKAMRQERRNIRRGTTVFPMTAFSPEELGVETEGHG